MVLPEAWNTFWPCRGESSTCLATVLVGDCRSDGVEGGGVTEDLIGRLLDLADMFQGLGECTVRGIMRRRALLAQE